MDLEFKVTCHVDFQTGKFASQDDIAEVIRGAIEGADPGDLTVNEGEYSVTEFNVESITQPSRRVLRKLARREDAKRQLIEAVMEEYKQGSYAGPRIRAACARLQRLNGEKS